MTDERWEHITSPMNHPEMLEYEEELRETIRLGTRKQEFLNPQKYRYLRKFENLTHLNTHIIVIVVFRFNQDVINNLVANNFIITAYQKKVW